MSYFIGWIDKGGTTHGGYPGSSFWSPRVFGDFRSAMDFGYELLEVGARRVWIHDGEEMIAEEESIRLCREDPEEWQREQEEQWRVKWKPSSVLDLSDNRPLLIS